MHIFVDELSRCKCIIRPVLVYQLRLVDFMAEYFHEEIHKQDYSIHLLFRNGDKKNVSDTYEKLKQTVLEKIDEKLLNKMAWKELEYRFSNKIFIPINVIKENIYLMDLLKKNVMETWRQGRTSYDHHIRAIYVTYKMNDIAIDEVDAQIKYRSRLSEMVVENIQETFFNCVSEMCNGCRDNIENQLAHLCIASLEEKINTCFLEALKRFDTDSIQINEMNFLNKENLLNDNEWIKMTENLFFRLNI